MESISIGIMLRNVSPTSVDTLSNISEIMNGPSTMAIRMLPATRRMFPPTTLFTLLLFSSLVCSFANLDKFTQYQMKPTIIKRPQIEERRPLIAPNPIMETAIFKMIPRVNISIMRLAVLFHNSFMVKCLNRLYH